MDYSKIFHSGTCIELSQDALQKFGLKDEDYLIDQWHPDKTFTVCNQLYKFKINDIDYGPTPMSIPLQVGKYVVSVEKQGIGKVTKRVTVDGNQERKLLRFQLRKE